MPVRHRRWTRHDQPSHFNDSKLSRARLCAAVVFVSAALSACGRPAQSAIAYLTPPERAYWDFEQAVWRSLESEIESATQADSGELMAAKVVAIASHLDAAATSLATRDVPSLFSEYNRHILTAYRGAAGGIRGALPVFREFLAQMDSARKGGHPSMTDDVRQQYEARCEALAYSRGFGVSESSFQQASIELKRIGAVLATRAPAGNGLFPGLRVDARLKLSFTPAVIPVTISVDSTGGITLSVTQSVVTPIGVFTVGAATAVDRGRMLTVRYRGRDNVFDMGAAQLSFSTDAPVRVVISGDVTGNILIELTDLDVPHEQPGSADTRPHPLGDDRPMAWHAGRTAGERKAIFLPNKVVMTLRWIPSGSFAMGSSAGPHERPVHTVTMSRGFWLAETPVTERQWCAVMGTTSHLTARGSDYPAQPLSWDECQRFCAKAAMGFRLPSEAEWEYACRAGSESAYCFGDDESELGRYAWCSIDPSDQFPHEVGKKRPNAWGLFDMHGNVLEWCEDTYQENYSGAPVDGTSWIVAGQKLRVLRGGTWGMDAKNLRSSSRPASASVNSKYGLYGLRPARAPD